MMYELPPAMRAVLHTGKNPASAPRSESRPVSGIPEPRRLHEARRRTAALRSGREFRIFNVDMGELLTPFTPVL